ncbi:hypothetical protein [Roseovarius sp. ZX-A-9]|uniref:hypothetical protein n=1 Tax=Roseovarius sp. ZX-A-9 TaxID=3014783 RepID=UPI00232F151D|nr:hypothetical protein [Roseovarius sp. ZX-A-9]
MIRAFAAAAIYAAAALAMAEVLDIQPVTDEPSVIDDTLEGTRACTPPLHTGRPPRPARPRCRASPFPPLASTGRYCNDKLIRSPSQRMLRGYLARVVIVFDFSIHLGMEGKKLIFKEKH